MISLRSVLDDFPNFLSWKKFEIKGMFQIPLAELIIYNNFALQFGIGER